MRRAILMLALVACSSKKAPPRKDDAASPPRPIEHRETCGDVTAIWRGTGQTYEELSFELGKGAAPIKMPTGDMYFSDWSFQIFSPDCKHVLLLYSHEGPYHIVQTARLAEYLHGGKPDHVLAGDPSTGSTGVFHDGYWKSNTEVTYQWGCCDPPLTTTFVLPP